MPVKSGQRDKSPEGQLAGFIAKYTPEIGALAREVRAKMQARLPGAVELVYDNYNFFVIGYGPSERPSEAVFSIVLAPRKVRLCFLKGASLPDPEKLLRGGGNVVRNITLEDASVLDRPAVKALMAEALKRSPKPFDKKAPHRLIIKSVSAKQRPRRPA